MKQAMGVVHFLLLGGSPGAATVGLSYCVENYSLWKKEKREILESVVVVTTQEVLSGHVKSPSPALLNRYGTIQTVKKMSGGPFESLERFIEDEFRDLINQNRGKIDTCLVEVNDFRSSVLNLASKLFKFKEKEVWLNITGGMNPMTVQSLFTAYLGGIVAKIYYTYVPQQYTSYLRPPGSDGTENFRFIEIPVVKAVPDAAYFRTLQIIKEKGGQIATEELKSRLRSEGLNIDRSALVKMRGHGVIIGDIEHTTLTKAGATLLSLYEYEDFRKYMQLVG